MLPLYFLAAAAFSALFLPSDTREEREPVPDLPLPPPSPPPPPAPDANLIPRGIPPHFFRRTAREVVSELQGLFSQAYKMEPKDKILSVRNPHAELQLGLRILQLEVTAIEDPWSAQEYNRPEIRRYHYFKSSTPEEAYKAVHMAANDIDLVELFRSTAEEQFVPILEDKIDPGSEEASPSSYFAILSKYRSVLDLKRLLAAGGQGAREFISRYEPKHSSLLEQILREASTEELVQIGFFANRYYYQGTWHLDEVQKEDISPLWERLRPHLILESESQTRREALKFFVWLSLLSASQGMDEIDFNQKGCQTKRNTGEMESCFNSIQLKMLTTNKDTFGDSDYYYQLQKRFRTYLNEYPVLSPRQRANGDHIFLGQLFFNILQEPKQRSRFGYEELKELTDKIRPNPNKIFYPPLQGRPYDHHDFPPEAARQEPIEVRVEELPIGWQKIYNKLQAPGNSPNKTLWDFMKEHIISVIVAPQFLEGQLGTLNPLTSTIFLQLPSDEVINPLKYIPALAHETYHLYFHISVASQKPNLINATLFNERNAYLFGLMVHREIIKRFNKLHSSSSDLRKLVLDNYAWTLLTIRAANMALGFTEGDERYHEDPPKNIDPQIMQRQPWQLIPSYLRQTDPEVHK